MDCASTEQRPVFLPSTHIREIFLPLPNFGCLRKELPIKTNFFSYIQLDPSEDHK